MHRLTVYSNMLGTLYIGVLDRFCVIRFPDNCLLVPFYIRVFVVVPCGGPKKSPRTCINAFIFPILRNGLQSVSIFLSLPFLDLHLTIANGFVSSKIYDKRDDFDIVFSVFGW